MNRTEVVGESPIKESKNNVTHTAAERTANTAVSSNLAIESDDEDDLQDVFEYDNVKTLRRVQ